MNKQLVSAYLWNLHRSPVKKQASSESLFIAFIPFLRPSWQIYCKLHKILGNMNINFLAGILSILVNAPYLCHGTWVLRASQLQGLVSFWTAVWSVMQDFRTLRCILQGCNSGCVFTCAAAVCQSGITTGHMFQLLPVLVVRRPWQATLLNALPAHLRRIHHWSCLTLVFRPYCNG